MGGSGGAGEGEDGAEVLRDLERNGVEVVAVIRSVSEPAGLRELVVEVVLSPTVQIKLLLRLRSSLITEKGEDVFIPWQNAPQIWTV